METSPGGPLFTSADIRTTVPGHAWARRGTVIVALALVAAACTTTEPGGQDSATSVVTAAPTSDVEPPVEDSAPAGTESNPDTAVDTTAGTTAGVPASCPATGPSVAWDADVTAQAVTLLETDDVVVDAVVYPRPDYEGRPWSQWGQGIALDDGRFLSAIGDHLGRDGNSYIYEYDPASRQMIRIADALSLTPHVDGDWGYGKIHAQMVAGPCDDVLVTTYWGSRRDLTFTETYRGDVLFRLDPADRTIENLGPLVESHGVPSLASTASGLLYAEAIDPLGPPGTPVGQFVAFDPASGETVFADTDPSHIGYRSIAVDAAGRAYYSAGGGELTVYDPASNSASGFGATMPGEFLRAVTPPTSSGSIIGVTQDPAVFFTLDPAGSITTLGEAQGYTTSLGLSVDESEVYYVPDAHGGSWQLGTPLIAVDTATGDQRVVVELNDAAESALGLRLGGTYSVATHGETIYIGMNAGDPGSDREAFGEVVLFIVNPA